MDSACIPNSSIVVRLILVLLVVILVGCRMFVAFLLLSFLCMLGIRFLFVTHARIATLMVESVGAEAIELDIIFINNSKFRRAMTSRTHISYLCNVYFTPFSNVRERERVSESVSVRYIESSAIYLCCRRRRRHRSADLNVAPVDDFEYTIRECFFFSRARFTIVIRSLCLSPLTSCVCVGAKIRHCVN